MNAVYGKHKNTLQILKIFVSDGLKSLALQFLERTAFVYCSEQIPVWSIIYWLLQNLKLAQRCKNIKYGSSLQLFFCFVSVLRIQRTRWQILYISSVNILWTKLYLGCNISSDEKYMVFVLPSYFYSMLPYCVFVNRFLVFTHSRRWEDTLMYFNNVYIVMVWLVGRWPHLN